jgi:hypothetical protein
VRLPREISTIGLAVIVELLLIQTEEIPGAVTAEKPIPFFKIKVLNIVLQTRLNVQEKIFAATKPTEPFVAVVLAVRVEMFA